jgi:predicted amidohydrolase
MRVAAVQLEAELGDVLANLEACEVMARSAASEGAELIVLPEFFTTGVGFLPELAHVAVGPEGAATRMLCSVAEGEGVMIGGSFLCRDSDGEVRNAFVLADRSGVVGRHDKDLPTAWENALYVGSSDDGVIGVGDLCVGVAMCWELIRSQTARRLRGRVDVVVGGSNWVTIPPWHPRPLTRRAEARNATLAASAPAKFARYVGAPVVHGAIAGVLECGLPDLPRMTYRGHYQGGAMVADAQGRILARREGSEGSGYVIADADVGHRQTPSEIIPDRFWLHRRDSVSATVWHTQRITGRRWYRSHVRGLPAFEPGQRTDTSETDRPWRSPGTSPG